jgi:hypothetical protein
MYPCAQNFLIKTMLQVKSENEFEHVQIEIAGQIEVDPKVDVD